ncbi:MAG: NUDIX hydrolase [Pseudomonadota bacterium]
MTLSDGAFREFGVGEPGPLAAISVLLRDAEGRFLLQLRDDRPDVLGGGMWGLFGGLIEPGEDLATAALREVAEETGMTLSAEELTPVAKTISEGAQRTRLYVAASSRRVGPGDIRLGEGAGFAFLTQRQLGSFSLVPALRPILDHVTRRNRAGGA